MFTRFVRQLEGLASLMDTLDEETKRRGVAISYDSRHKSQEFAFESARVLGAHGILSFVFESSSDSRTFVYGASFASLMPGS